MTEQREPPRPDPDALLAEALRESRGRLKVYLGMAPGVGKTYAMLEGARRAKGQGLDVVIGIVETHGRKETEALLEGFEILPRKQIAYHGHTLTEFDIDAALARRPKLLIVDEYAHTNVPESRHTKRWQDIEELTKAGINVDTALNIQHLEGLNDVIARITGVRVRETVPDQMLEKADEIELIDLTPDELTERLKEGKVYAGDLAGRALENFFKLGNLSALRELALRRTAERVDQQMVGYMRSHAIEGPWAAGERLMALVGPDHNGSFVVRATHRLADQLKAPWIAVTVETPEQAIKAGGGVDEAMALAESLGSRSERLVDGDIPAAILRYARKNNVTQIVVGRSRDSWWKEVLHRSLPQELVRRSQGIAIHVITAKKEAPSPSIFRWPQWSSDWRTILSAIVSVAAVVGLGVAVPSFGEPAVIGMLLLAAVLLSAAQGGFAASIFAALLAFLCYNFFFTVPHYTFAVKDWRDVLALFVFLAVAVTAGTLAGRTRDQALAARGRMTALQTLFDFSRRLGGTVDVVDLTHAIVLQAHRLTEKPTMLLQPVAGDLVIRYSWPPEDALDTSSWAAARWAHIHSEPAGRSTGTLPSASWYFLPLKTARGNVGVFGIAIGSGLSSEVAQTLDALLDLSAIALERVNLVADATRAEALAETERLRSALLSSISHDLRTPLTAILGSVTGLRATPDAFDSVAREDLLATIQEEAERLDRFVRNLLDMTRLESGALDFKREWFSPGDLIDAVTRRFAKHVADKQIASIVHPNLPLLRADFVLLETTLFNLLDNAVKHAEGARNITVTALQKTKHICFEVRDDGPGISADDLPRLFDKFFRVQRGDAAVAGTGLGLAICKGLVEAMGGEISAASPIADGRGAAFTVCFPIEKQPERESELEAQT
jgi:two-component system sensor histidine kinase KdpD